MRTYLIKVEEFGRFWNYLVQARSKREALTAIPAPCRVLWPFDRVVDSRGNEL